MENTDINITIIETTEPIDAPSENILGDIELQEHCSTDLAIPADMIVENIDIKLSDANDIESNDSFYAIKSNHNIKHKHKYDLLLSVGLIVNFVPTLAVPCTPVTGTEIGLIIAPSCPLP
jgi:hypothetical protein